ncbi:MAG: hypothetical protein OXU23_02555 [Candidatus Poribacteria bacterium]|nr:hypothetical protein [Candidatus Poribacteria bacterium]
MKDISVVLPDEEPDPKNPDLNIQETQEDEKTKDKTQPIGFRLSSKNKLTTSWAKIKRRR